MSLTKIDWQPLQIKDPTNLKPAIGYLHRAAQFPAIMGNSLLPTADDDSQSSLEWVPELKSLVGAQIELATTFRMGLNYEKFELHAYSETFSPISILPLTGQTRSQVMGYLKQLTQKLGGNPDKIEPISHYQLPGHEVDHKGVFQVTDPEHNREMVRYRTNIRHILEALKPYFSKTSDIRVWPHHFDTGMLIEVGPEKRIGVGMAIPDEFSPEPYFYINHQAENIDPDYSDLSPLPGGGQWTEGKPPLAFLRMSQILKRDDVTQQLRQIAHFFEEGINTSLELIDAKKFKMEGETTA